MNRLRKFLADWFDPVQRAERRFRREANANHYLQGAISIHNPKRNIEEVQELLDKGVNVNAYDLAGRTPLMVAVEDGWVEVVRLLLEHGANVNDNWGEGRLTVLMLACIYGGDQNLETIRCLLDRGANINAEDALERSALIWAVRKGHSQIVRLFLERGTNLSTREYYALNWAVGEGNTDIVSIMLDARADVNGRDRLGETPLITAAWANNVNLVRLLLEQGADVHAQDLRNRTALSLALENGHTEIVEMLRQAGA